MTDLIVPAVLPKSWKVKNAHGNSVTFIATDPLDESTIEVTLSSDAPHFEPVAVVLGNDMHLGPGTDGMPLHVTVM